MGLISGTEGRHSIYCGVKYNGAYKQESVYYGAEYLEHIDLSQYIVGLNIWDPNCTQYIVGSIIWVLVFTNRSQYIRGVRRRKNFEFGGGVDP